MLKPPRAAKLKLSAFGKMAKADGAAKGRQDQLIMRGHNGWRASGYAQLPEGRAADAVILGLDDDAGKWFAIAAAPPGGPLNYLEKGTRMDLQFLANTGPQCGAWEIYLPLTSLETGLAACCERGRWIFGNASSTDFRAIGNSS